MNNSPWKYTIKFINNCVGEGEKFLTGDQLEYVKKRKQVSPSTLFSHRVILRRLGFLEETTERGVWIKIKDFPYDVGKSMAQRAAFPKYGWESWFLPPGWPLLPEYKNKRG